jgi:hypothetical protein
VPLLQAALDEIKNADDSTAEKLNKRVVIRAQVGDEKEIVLGTLSYGRCDQMPLDLVFGRDFKISHNSPDCSIYVCGYRTQAPDGELYCSDEEDEDRHYLDASLAKGKCLLHPILKVPLSQNQVIFHAGIAIWLF